MKESIFGEVKGIYNRLTFMEIIVAILWAIIGIIMISDPGMSNQIFSILTGILFIIIGVNSLYSFLKRGTILLYNLNIFYGIIMILLGILTVIFNNALKVLLGIIFISLGLQKSTYGMVLKKFSESSWLITLVVGILYIVMGVISFFTNDIISVCGIFLVGYGLIDLVSVILLRKRSKYYID